MMNQQKSFDLLNHCTLTVCRVIAISPDHKNLTQREAVYFADFNLFITWPKHSPCVAQFYKQ